MLSPFESCEQVARLCWTRSTASTVKTPKKSLHCEVRQALGFVKRSSSTCPKRANVRRISASPFNVAFPTTSTLRTVHA